MLSPPCGQVYVDLERTTFLGFGVVDANGEVNLPPIDVPASLCRKAVQVVDEATCRPTPRAP